MRKNNETGARGERLAEEYLREKGYFILNRNWHYVHKEVDLIARDGDTLVFVEIKTRHGWRFGFPEESVSIKKQQNLRDAASAYLEQYPEFEWVRFDVITIVFQNERIDEFRHLIDAF